MGFGIGDRVEILHSCDLSLIGKESVIVSVCGKGATKYYHLKIDGEQKAFWPQNLRLIKKADNNIPEKKRR